ncbi:phage tail spike protein [Caproiciproducens galactitolivorans]|uniref:Phage tail protein n=1 Tax=Caproiciproducens galactitolivorans TaxID=642589 RepID=A0ABT4BT16_9FIRM|nr:phage tail spike protein [Caproiciproducens galactitolivorans]MCY1714046.1 phage tail protein [Caproiciproducens galactitolivorans]
MILVYDSNAREFDNNGLGTVAPISCVVSEEINGAFELELTHPVDSFGKWKRLQKNNIVRANTHRGAQAFRIYRVVKDAVDGTIRVNARHIFYDLLANFVEDVRPTGKIGAEAGQQILDGCQYPTPFTFSSNIMHTSTAYFIRQSPVQAFLGDTDQAFISRWGGEIVRDNYNIAVNTRLGANNGVRIAYGKNMAGLEFQEDASGVATRILPTALTEDNQVLLLPEKYIDSPRISDYPFPVITAMDTGYQVGKEVDGAVPYPTVESCYDAMRQFVTDRYLAGADIPTLSLSVDFVDWKDISGYEKYKSLLTVNLGDDVTVDYAPFGVSVKLRVCAVSYDCLTDRFETLTIGEKRISVVNSINSASRQISEVKQEITVTNQTVSAVTGSVEDINSDDKLTPGEKSAALREWSAFANEKETLAAQAAALGISAELSDYNDAFQLLSNYLNGGALYTSGVPLWLDDEHRDITTDISGEQYRQKFAEYYAARNTLVRAITAKLKALADTAQNGVDSNAGEITTINSTLTTIQTDVGGLRTTVSSIDNQISNTEDGIALRLSNAESTIEQHDSSIQTKVESSTFDGYVTDNDSKLEDVETQITVMRQAVDGLSLSVSRTGYRNLLKNSAGRNGLTFWDTAGTVATVSNTDTSNNTVSNSAFLMAAGSAISQEFSLKFNAAHTVSLLFRSSGSGGEVKVSIEQNSAEAVLYDNTDTGTDWTFVTFQFNSLDTVCTLKITASVEILASDLIVSEGTNVAPWVQSDEELYTTNFIADGTGLTIGSNTTDMKAHISTSAFEIYRGDDLRINVAPDGTRLQKTIIEDDLTVGSVKEIVRAGAGVDFVVL